MESTAQRDTGPEIKLRRALHAAGLRYRVDLSPMPGVRSRADILFPRLRIAVFVDGCFWHGCPEHGTWPKNNAAWWRKKITDNQARDRRVDEVLGAAGWVVVRVWEHEEPETALRLVEAAVVQRKWTPVRGTSALRRRAPPSHH